MKIILENNILTAIKPYNI